MQIPVDSYRLPNGLMVVLSEDHSAPIVAVNLWYHVGSANEREGRTGFACESYQSMTSASGALKDSAINVPVCLPRLRAAAVGSAGEV